MIPDIRNNSALKVPRLRLLVLLIMVILRWRWTRSVGGVVLTGKHRNTRREILQSATSPHKIPIMDCPGIEPKPPRWHTRSSEVHYEVNENSVPIRNWTIHRLRYSLQPVNAVWWNKFFLLWESYKRQTHFVGKLQSFVTFRLVCHVIGTVL